MILRKVEEKDLDAIVEIENDSFKAPYQMKDFLYELNENPYSNFYVAINDDQIVGFYILWITFDSATICKIATKKDLRKMGFANLMMTHALNLAKEKDCEFVTLEVRKSNIPAIKLYEKFGFSYVTTKQNYYDDGEDALYMVKGMI